MKGYKHLNRERRYTIAQMYKQGSSLRTIAQTIEVSASTVSRELRRNRHKQGYTAPHADMLAQERIEWRRYSRCFTESLRNRSEELLRSYQWSPEQISGCLRREGIAMVGKTTLYKWLHEDKRRGGDLYRFCRHGLRYRRQRLVQPKNSKKRGRYKSILERPEIVASQGRIGDLEMDLILGATPKSHPHYYRPQDGLHLHRAPSARAQIEAFSPSSE